jgi:peptidyl-prolyl cis-trans isomerase A (cyclophilin A)
MGTVTMARTSDPDSATAQFFINVADNPRLDHGASGGNGYAVFGEVVSGMDVVHRIMAVKTGQKNGMSDVPNQPVVIESVLVATGA